MSKSSQRAFELPCSRCFDPSRPPFSAGQQPPGPRRSRCSEPARESSAGLRAGAVREFGQEPVPVRLVFRQEPLKGPQHGSATARIVPSPLSALDLRGLPLNVASTVCNCVLCLFEFKSEIWSVDAPVHKISVHHFAEGVPKGLCTDVIKSSFPRPAASSALPDFPAPLDCPNEKSADHGLSTDWAERGTGTGGPRHALSHRAGRPVSHCGGSTKAENQLIIPNSKNPAARRRVSRKSPRRAVALPRCS